MFDARVYCSVVTDVPRKPDPEPFKRVVESFGVAAGTVFVGNSIEVDVAGVAATGLDSAWLPVKETASERTPTYRVDRLGEVCDVAGHDRQSEDPSSQKYMTGTETFVKLTTCVARARVAEPDQKQRN